MPCYITGTVKITNMNLLYQAADSLDIKYEVNNGRQLVSFTKNGINVATARNGEVRYNKEQNYGLLQNYGERLVKLQAQKKGWQVESVKTEERTGKLVLMLRE